MRKVGIEGGGDRTIRWRRTTDDRVLSSENGSQLMFRKFPQTIYGKIRHGVLLF
jgi:hypothetical protein